MKRTNREKDGPFATSLGGEMLAAKDPNGWLHLFDVDVLRRALGKVAIPPRLEAIRPLLKLAPFRDTIQVKRLLLAERLFWSEIDELRVKIFQKRLRAYLSAVRKSSGGRRDLPLPESHAIRVECARRFLSERPLRDYGLEKMVADARTNVRVTLGDDVIDWLPAAEGNFYAL
ncbi:MAG: hypothetical protein ABI680_09305 [Chthoniobacteraceae bacterium]